ncbi:MAG TPA: DEAD/DEAH box helicase [Candidatus Poseidoniaceae archaeon]|nr:MAG TPA: DEAD/DEAH box helicase [Candidatus Poseidoniales archaeon]HII30870.1 DEAD/DEAH box helicase [Candidatus Poseidoniaceae archaeon]|tara:strand:- start:1837 stop:3255 length:1419 start_codon:yes stop_codon:yes gene_type:complete
MFTKTRFDSLVLPDSIMQGIASLGWECLTEVQRDTIPIARSGQDVIGQARTGSGKTAAFGIPILERCQPTGSLQGLVLAPTRELAQQVAEEMNQLQGDAGLSIMTVYGGTDLEKQAKGLDDGVDLIVGTPGRVMDMSERGHLDLAKVEIFCLDEADRMLDMGFLPDILWILERTTARKQTLLFSATFPQEILDAANEFTNNPEFVMTNEEELDVPPIDLYKISIGRANKLWALGRLLVRMGDDDQCIIFCNTKRMVDLAVQRLQKHKFDVAGLHGDLKQNQRERILDRFREGEVRIVAATDVAARGIDIDGITLVVNYDVPSDIDSFIHRIGRTGRIGRHGEAWSLVSKDDAPQMGKIIATYNLDVQETDAPDLPEGVDRDPVRKQDDFGENADVYGFVSIRLGAGTDQLGSPLQIASWFEQHLRCDALAIGDIRFEGDSTVVAIHSSKLGLAMKAIQTHQFGSLKVDAEVL